MRRLTLLPAVFTARTPSPYFAGVAPGTESANTGRPFAGIVAREVAEPLGAATPAAASPQCAAPDRPAA
jgi:hypothetical protein